MIDEKDKKIIDVLKKDSRLSVRDISKKTTIRPSTVHSRIKHLKDKGVIEKFTVKLNNSAVGEGFIVFMLVTTSQDVGKGFLNDSRVKEVFGITGEYDLMIKLKFSGIEDFNQYIIGLRKNAAIQKTVTLVSTVNLKEEL